MNRIYITFSGHQYHDTTRRIVEDAPKFGADQVVIYDDFWLRTTQHDFYQKLLPLLNHHSTRGYGWFAWKPYVILHALRHADPGDAILFTDADTYPIADLRTLYDIGQRDGIMLFESCGWKQKSWCTQATYRIMGIDPESVYEKPHGCARFMVFTDRHAAFLEEWMHYCLVMDCTTFDPRPEYGAEHPEFRQHRTEQAIFTNLAHKYSHRLYREACQFGDHFEQDRDLFPTLFFQDGTHTFGRSQHGQGSDFRTASL